MSKLRMKFAIIYVGDTEINQFGAMIMWKYGRGDDGKSETLANMQEKLWKDEDIFKAIGDIDELNSYLGLVVSVAKEINPEKLVKVINALITIQKDLFKIGGMVNSYGSKFYEKIEKISDKDLEKLEQFISDFSENLEELKSFILPGGSILASHLHVARTICRRAERSYVTLYRGKKYPKTILTYLNRLSTLLFVIARHVNQLLGFEDVPP